ncbi:MAG: type I 3-dehydroquinate dehydratase [Planctomycetes bacterium]|nr:type I 3-dehydroquinate dehydratase [Planctomycetota bacterium]
MRAALANPQHIAHKHGVWFEVRLDLEDAWLDVLADAKAALEPLRAPGRNLIATCRRRDDGGAFTASDDQRRAVLKAAEPFADFVDLELDETLNLPRDKVIRSYHNLEQMPRDLDPIIRGLRTAGGRYIKLAVRAEALCDNLRIRDLIKKEGRDLAAMCIGEYGIPSRVLGEAWGSALSYAAMGPAALAPGMLSLRDMLLTYGAHNLTAATPVYGVTGARLGHSLSPQLHNAALRRSGIGAVYLPLAARDTTDFLRFARTLPVPGASVTIPFKEEIARHCVSLDEAARASGAVNTVKLDEHGSLRGYNTDAAGFKAALEGEFGKIEPGCRFLVLGAGGSARAVVHALRSAGAYVGVWARRADHGRALCKALGAESIASPSPAIQWECVINCTPCGQRGGAGYDSTPIAFEDLRPALHPRAVFYDVVYEPALTPLTARAQAEGFKTANGLSMLLRQGEAQAAMFGYLPQNSMFEPPQRPRGRLIWLVGMRGAGKSTLAPALARELGVPAFDLDALIELRQGQPVADIFARKGEPHFRVLEDAELSLLAAREQDGVVATGGGVVENPRLIETMRNSGRVLWLDVPADELRKRVAAGGARPALTGANVATELDAVLARRKPMYQRAAHAVIETGARPASVLAGEIARSLAQSKAV